MITSESKLENDQEIFEKALEKLIVKGHVPKHQIEVLKKLYRKIAEKNRQMEQKQETMENEISEIKTLLLSMKFS